MFWCGGGLGGEQARRVVKIPGNFPGKILRKREQAHG
jgi:hypothetical protein